MIHEYENLTATFNGVEFPVRSLSYEVEREPVEPLPGRVTYVIETTFKAPPTFLDAFFPPNAGCPFCGQGRVYSNHRRAELALYGRWTRHVCPRGTVKRRFQLANHQKKVGQP